MTVDRFPMRMTRSERACRKLQRSRSFEPRQKRFALWDHVGGKLDRAWHSAHRTPAGRRVRILWRLVSTARWS